MKNGSHAVLILYALEQHSHVIAVASKHRRNDHARTVSNHWIQLLASAEIGPYRRGGQSSPSGEGDKSEGSCVQHYFLPWGDVGLDLRNLGMAYCIGSSLGELSFPGLHRGKGISPISVSAVEISAAPVRQQGRCPIEFAGLSTSARS